MHFSAIFRQFSWRYYNRNCAFYTQSSILVWLLDLTHQFNVFSEKSGQKPQTRLLNDSPRLSLSFFDIYRFSYKNMWRDNFSHFPFFTRLRHNFIYLRLISLLFLTQYIFILVLILNVSLSPSLLQQSVEGRGEGNASFKHSKYLQGDHLCCFTELY